MLVVTHLLAIKIGYKKEILLIDRETHNFAVELRIAHCGTVSFLASLVRFEQVKVTGGKLWL